MTGQSRAPDSACLGEKSAAKLFRSALLGVLGTEALGFCFSETFSSDMGLVMCEKVGTHCDAKQTSCDHASASCLDQASFHGTETADGFAALQQGEVGVHFVGGAVLPMISLGNWRPQCRRASRRPRTGPTD